MVVWRAKARVWWLVAGLIVAGCAPVGTDGRSLIASSTGTGLTPLQNCAIGYDLAKQIFDRVTLSQTVIVPARRPTECEAYTVRYLRRAGFAIDENGVAPPMEVEIVSASDGTIIAVATVGGRLKLTRQYAPAAEGVYPRSAVTFLELPPGAKLQRRAPREEPLGFREGGM